MKILVLAPKANDRKVAATMLKDHEVVVVGTYDDAQKALTPQTDHDKAQQIRQELMTEHGYAADFNPRDEKVTETERNAYQEAWSAAWNKSMKSATTYPDWDIVITDLMIPASGQAQGRDSQHLIGKEMPLGSTIALLALTNGVKKVAVITDVNHHNHPASAAFDDFGDAGGTDDVRVFCTNHCSCSFDTVSGKKFGRVDWNDKEACADRDRRIDAGEIVDAKDWIGILKQLTGESTSED